MPVTVVNPAGDELLVVEAGQPWYLVKEEIQERLQLARGQTVSYLQGLEEPPMLHILKDGDIVTIVKHPVNVDIFMSEA